MNEKKYPEGFEEQPEEVQNLFKPMTPEDMQSHVDQILDDVAMISEVLNIPQIFWAVDDATNGGIPLARVKRLHQQLGFLLGYLPKQPRQ